jgi:hypothetical protein|tara:strand:- start:1119 stop:1481 length:363 start_codon:yes stop_codon:yes gene_type:complete
MTLSLQIITVEEFCGNEMVLTNKQKFNKKYGFDKDESHSLNEIAKITKVKKSILQQSYNRGVGAWKGNIQSVRLKSGKKDPTAPRSRKMSKEQWSYARVYSMLMGGKADPDLQSKIKGNK